MQPPRPALLLQAPREGVEVPPPLTLGLGLLGLGVVLVAFGWRRRARSFLRDLLLIVGLALPLLGGAILWNSLLPAGTRGHDSVRLVLILVTSALSIFAVSRIVVTSIRWWGSRSEPVRSSQRTLERVARVLVLVLGLLVVLDVLKVPISPLLTTLGIGSLAVALALQDTLANFFAGLYIAADRPLREGDYIKLGSGEEGVVLGVGWRSTRLRTPEETIVIVPNAKLAQTSITNFDLLDRKLVVSVRIPVAYGQDPERVRRILGTVAGSAAGKVAGLVAHPAPSVDFEPGFGDLGLEFTISAHVESVEHVSAVKTELRLRAAQGLRAEGIELLRSGHP